MRDDSLIPFWISTRNPKASTWILFSKSSLSKRSIYLLIFDVPSGFSCGSCALSNDIKVTKRDAHAHPGDFLPSAFALLWDSLVGLLQLTKCVILFITLLSWFSLSSDFNLLKREEFKFIVIPKLQMMGRCVSLSWKFTKTLLPWDLDRSKTIMWWHSQTKPLLDITDCHLFIYKRTLSVIIAIYINTSSNPRATKLLYKAER